MTKSVLAVGITLEKRGTTADIPKKAGDQEHVETKYLPHKKRIITKNASEGTQKFEIKKGIVGFNGFVCEICAHESAQQLDFYNHLKIHYERTKRVDIKNNDSKRESKCLNGFEKEELKTVPRSPVDTLVLNSKDVILVIPENILGLKANKESRDNDFQGDCKDLNVVPLLEESRVGLDENSSIVDEELLKVNENIKIESNEGGDKIIKKTKVKCEKQYPCNLCGKILLSSAAKTVHQRIHSDSRPFPCAVCGLSFRQLGDLRYHQQSKHSDLPEFQCEFCGKEFARKYSLTLHRKIHTGELSHPCDYCDKSFRAAVYLQNHRRIHTGEKPFSCSKCMKKFRVKADVNRHLKVHAARELKSSSELESHHFVKSQIEFISVGESQLENPEFIGPDSEEGMVVTHQELLVGGDLLDVGIVLN